MGKETGPSQLRGRKTVKRRSPRAFRSSMIEAHVKWAFLGSRTAFGYEKDPVLGRPALYAPARFELLPPVTHHRFLLLKPFR
jgi:hypothetical protein